jgi:hypothetical protein
MKTVKELKEEIVGIKYQIENEPMKPATQKRLRKRIPFLNTCIMYVETNPSRDFIKKQLDDCEAKINLRMAQFPLDEYMSMEPPMDKPSVRKLRTAHEKKYEIPHLRDQVRALRFLLKK